jgi:hypothetical protein
LLESFRRRLGLGVQTALDGAIAGTSQVLQPKFGDNVFAGTAQALQPKFDDTVKVKLTGIIYLITVTLHAESCDELHWNSSC